MSPSIRAPHSYSSSPQPQLCQLCSGCMVRHCTSPPCHTGVTTCVLRANLVMEWQLGGCCGLFLFISFPSLEKKRKKQTLLYNSFFWVVKKISEDFM